MAVVLVLLAIMVWYTHLPEIETDTDEDFVTANGTLKTNVFQFPNLILGFISLFFYVGVEVMAGDTIVPYGQSQGIPLDVARKFTAFTLASMVFGYIIGIFLIPKYIKQNKALVISAGIGIFFSLAAIFSKGYCKCILYWMPWPCKCDHVAGHLAIGHFGSGKIYQKRICVVDYGHCRRSNNTISICLSDRYFTQLPATILDHGPDLQFYFVFRLYGYKLRSWR